jgi:hypothetical protein
MTEVEKYTIKNHTFVEYDCEKHGHIKQRIELYKKTGCPYCHRGKESRLVYGVGIVPKGIMGKNKTAYNVWIGMLLRCYSKSYQKKEPSYIGKSVCDEWKNFENFLTWFNENYVDGFELDKDILKKNNSIYSPSTCCFVPKEINNLFVKRHTRVNGLPSGVHYDKVRKKYTSTIINNGKTISLGRFDSVEDAFNVYKFQKERKIKDLATKHKNQLKPRVFEVLMNYKLEITD